jgi:hypothetical protein
MQEEVYFNQRSEKTLVVGPAMSREFDPPGNLARLWKLPVSNLRVLFLAEYTCNRDLIKSVQDKMNSGKSMHDISNDMREKLWECHDLIIPSADTKEAREEAFGKFLASIPEIFHVNYVRRMLDYEGEIKKPEDVDVVWNSLKKCGRWRDSESPHHSLIKMIFHRHLPKDVSKNLHETPMGRSSREFRDKARELMEPSSTLSQTDYLT